MKDILGEWVPNSQIDPFTNVWGREWMSADGKYFGTYRGHQAIPIEALEAGILWHFTPEQCTSGK